MHIRLFHPDDAAALTTLLHAAYAELGAQSVGLDTALPAAHLVALYEKWGFRSRDVIHWPGKTYRSTVMILQSI